VKVGKKKQLAVEVDFTDNGALKRKFTSPFQSPAFKGIQVKVRDSNGDGVPDQVVVTAKNKKGKAVTAVFSGLRGTNTTRGTGARGRSFSLIEELDHVPNLVPKPDTASFSSFPQAEVLPSRASGAGGPLPPVRLPDFG
jgi:hypothetical protein